MSFVMYSFSKLNKSYFLKNIDDCWQLETRTSAGAPIADPKRFPHGIKYLADYAHSKGLKLGIYSDVGLKTCQGRAGSYGYYDIDAQTYASWEVDYLKFDFCNLAAGQKEQPWIYYSQMSEALNKTGRPIVFSICNWGVQQPWKWAPEIANLWRSTGDIESNYASVMSILDQNRDLYAFSGPYAFNDPDMLEVGVETSRGKLSFDESVSHFTLWCMLNAPLILGNNLQKIEDWVLQIITNSEVIAFNQDSLVKQAQLALEIKQGTFDKDGDCRSASCKWTQVWYKELSENKVAVLMLNRAGPDSAQDTHFNATEVISFTWESIGYDPSVKVLVRDVWQHKNFGVFKETFTSIPLKQHQSQTVVLIPTQ